MVHQVACEAHAQDGAPTSAGELGSFCAIVANQLTVPLVSRG